MGTWESSKGGSDEWYTPRYVFDAIGETFDLDVAHPANCKTHVPTHLYYSSESLSLPWFGFIWMNPPFGGRGSLSPWLDKFFAHGNGIALTPDRTSAPWFRDAWDAADLALFTPKMKFIRDDGTIGGQPSNGTCLWAKGERARTALIRAAQNDLGILAQPISVTQGRSDLTD